MRDWLPDIAIVAGAGAIAFGAHLIYTPAGVIIAGVFAIGIGVLMQKGGK